MATQTIDAGYFKALKIIFFALLTGQVLFLIISYSLVNYGDLDIHAKELEKVFVYIVPFFYLVSILAGYAIFKKKITQVKQEQDLATKLEGYRGLYITRFALLEFATLFAIIAYLITGMQMFIVIAGLSILSFLTLKPSKEKLMKELELGSEELSSIS